MIISKEKSVEYYTGLLALKRRALLKEKRALIFIRLL